MQTAIVEVRGDCEQRMLFASVKKCKFTAWVALPGRRSTTLDVTYVTHLATFGPAGWASVRVVGAANPAKVRCLLSSLVCS